MRTGDTRRGNFAGVINKCIFVTNFRQPEMKKIFLIIEREFSIRVRKKSFILTTILVPVLMAALMVVPFLIQSLKDVEAKTLAVIDRSGLAAQALTDSDELTFVFFPGASLDSLKGVFRAQGWYAIVDIGRLDEERPPAIGVYSFRQTNLDVQNRIRSRMEQAVEARKLASYAIPGLEAILASIKTPLSVQTYLWDDEGQEKASFTLLYMGVAYVFSLMIYMFITMFGSLVMRGVIEEKTSRIVEIILSSIKPFQLMVGKIVGIASVGLLQFCIWVVLTAALYLAVMQGFLVPEAVSAAGVAGVPGDVAGASTAGLGASPDLRAMLESVNFAAIIGAFICYFLFGYFLYASLFAAIGSAVESETDTQQLVVPITIPLIIGLLIMIHTFQYPNSPLSFWCSMIPFTSPMVMMARIPFGVPFREVALSLSLLLVTFVGIAWIAGKIYRVGVLMYGKKPGFKELWKWIFY